MRSKSYLFLLLVLGLGIAAGFVYSQTKYKFGLDVRGGVALTYQMLLTPQQKDKAEEIRGNLLKILGNRAQGPLAVTEPNIVAKGEDQIVVELPGATDPAKAQEVIGSSAKIQFYWARNVTTRQDTNRLYTAIDDDKNGVPNVNFASTIGGGKEYKYGDPEYARIIQGWQLILEGQDLESASVETHGTGYEPLMRFSREGAAKMERWSRMYAGKEENLAAVLDGHVISISPVERSAILSDNAVINGTFTADYVKQFTDLLNAGALPVDLKLLSSQHEDATIGLQALDKIVTAGVIAFAAISVFMLAYYAFPGFVAVIALSLYVLFTLAVLKLSNATFSLAGIAGFILSVGMAVDANILVFERFKEEMKRGRPLASAIELGFRRALPAIVDSNFCTILTSMVLAYLGTGPVKGFATTLIIGVIISLFTAVAVTRSLLVFFGNVGFASNPKLYAVDRNWFKKFEERADTEPVQVVNKAKRWFWLSGISILVCLPFVFIGGLKRNVEFSGGFELDYRVGTKTVSGDDLQANLTKLGIRGANVKFGGEGSARVAMVNVPLEGALTNVNAEQAQDIVGKDLAFSPAEYGGTTKIGPAIAAETIRNAIIGVIVSSGLIIVYLALRFGFALGGFVAGLRFGTSAIGALVHDVLFVVGFSAVVGYFKNWEDQRPVYHVDAHGHRLLGSRHHRHLRPNSGEPAQAEGGRRPRAPDEPLDHPVVRAVAQYVDDGRPDPVHPRSSRAPPPRT